MSSEPDPIGENQYPEEWLRAVALATDKMVSAPEVRAKLRALILQWRRHQTKPGIEVGVYLYPKREQTLREKAAIIGAIHDEIFSKAPPISPWAAADAAWSSLDGQGENLDRATVQEMQDSVKYAILKQDVVPKLHVRGPDIIEGWYDEVRVALGLSPEAHTTKSGGTDGVVVAEGGEPAIDRAGMRDLFGQFKDGIVEGVAAKMNEQAAAIASDSPDEQGYVESSSGPRAEGGAGAPATEDVAKAVSDVTTSETAPKEADGVAVAGGDPVGTKVVAEEASSHGGAGGKTDAQQGHPVALDEVAIKILEELAKRPLRLHTGYSLETAAGFPRKTVDLRVKEMISTGLVRRKLGSGGGVSITENGIAYLSPPR